MRMLGLLTGVAVIASPAMAQTKFSGPKAEVVRGVDARAKLAQEINDSLFSFAELGFQEVETEKYLTALLEREGFTVTRGVAGLPTGWVAKWSNGAGGPTLALGSDIDGIPKASQTPGIPWKQPLSRAAPAMARATTAARR